MPSEIDWPVGSLTSKGSLRGRRQVAADRVDLVKRRAEENAQQAREAERPRIEDEPPMRMEKRKPSD